MHNPNLDAAVWKKNQQRQNYTSWVDCMVWDYAMRCHQAWHDGKAFERNLKLFMSVLWEHQLDPDAHRKLLGQRMGQLLNRDTKAK